MFDFKGNFSIIEGINFDWLLTFLPDSLFYNITFLLSISSCNENLQQTNQDTYKANGWQENSNKEQSFFTNLINLFNFQHIKEAEKENLIGGDVCSPVIHIFCNRSISSHVLLIICIFFICAFIGLIFCWSFRFLCKTNKDNKKLQIESQETFKKLSSSDKCITYSSSKKVSLEFPIKLNIFYCENNLKGINEPSSMQIYEATVEHYLKEVSFFSGMDWSSLFSQAGYSSLASTSSSSLTSVSSITSPRLNRRTIPQNRRGSPSTDIKQPNVKFTKENSTHFWIKYEQFQSDMKWVYPDIVFDIASVQQLSKNDDKLSSILQFLHQKCIKSQQWSMATSVISYTLFLLQQELKCHCLEVSELFTFSKFESVGSASDGTLIVCADRFDMLVVFELSKCGEFLALHSNLTPEIPAGQVILGARDTDNTCTNKSYLKKTAVENIMADFLLPNEFEDYIEILIKKIVLKLNSSYRNKFDKLPFSFQMSSSKKLTISFDTRFMQGFGVDIAEINLRLIPAISLSCPENCLLPPVYAVPSWGDLINPRQNGNTQAKSVLGRIFRDGSLDHLFWNLSTEKLKASIVTSFEHRLQLSGVRGCHRLCQMTLKALFSQGNKNKLLNKGEVDAHIISHVVSFLLQESPSSAWTYDNLPDRVSDAIHFLRSSYHNIWLPNFAIHNPHLVAKMPCLENMAPLLSGKQQNLLAHVSEDAALKVLDYIELRLQETGLAKCVKSDFSSQMWEYEFFMFG